MQTNNDDTLGQFVWTQSGPGYTALEGLPTNKTESVFVQRGQGGVTSKKHTSSGFVQEPSNRRRLMLSKAPCRLLAVHRTQGNGGESGCCRCAATGGLRNRYHIHTNTHDLHDKRAMAQSGT